MDTRLPSLERFERQFHIDGTIEAAVWNVVVAANALGFPTHASCEGHARDDAPYVAFGFDYGDHAPDDPAVADRRAVNLVAREQICRRVAEFNTSREMSTFARLTVEPGANADDLRRLRARFAKERAALARTDPARLAEGYNDRQYEDTFCVRAGNEPRLARLWTPARHGLLKRRQAEMRAFGLVLRREAEAIGESHSRTSSSGIGRSSAP